MDHKIDGFGRIIRLTKKEQYNKLTDKLKRYVYGILKQSKCVDCGYDNWLALEFDHIKGEKIASISEMIVQTRPLKKIKEEIAKCEIRCCNCHRIKTTIQLGWNKINY